MVRKEILFSGARVPFILKISSLFILLSKLAHKKSNIFHSAHARFAILDIYDKIKHPFDLHKLLKIKA